MSQLIVTSRYLKNGNQKNKTKRRNYTKYIATRETVEIRSQKFVDRNANATKNQEQLINDLINDFPESKDTLSMMTMKESRPLRMPVIDKHNSRTQC